MPHYYFHVQNGQGFTRDEEGVDLPDEGAARAMAIDSIRSIIAEEARKGVIDLDGFIDVHDDTAVKLTRVAFDEAFAMRFASDNNRV